MSELSETTRARAGSAGPHWHRTEAGRVENALRELVAELKAVAREGRELGNGCTLDPTNSAGFELARDVLDRVDRERREADPAYLDCPSCEGSGLTRGRSRLCAGCEGTGRKPFEMRQSCAVEAYRAAVRRLWPQVTEDEARAAIVHPSADPGRWAPGALAVIYTEPSGRDAGHVAELLGCGSYGGGDALANCLKLDAEAGVGAFVEWINGAVAAVWPS